MMHKKLLKWEKYLQIHKSRRHLLDFYRFSWSYAVPKSNLHPRIKVSYTDVTNPEIVCMLLLFQILHIDWFILKKKTITLTENLLNFNWAFTDRKQPFESFLKMDALTIWVVNFWGDWCVFTNLNFILFYFTFLSRFSFTNIHGSQGSAGRGRVSIYFLSTTSTRFTDA